jgi:transcriptional regulator with XRE-family HTH domain
MAPPPLTSAQIRAARALIRWTAEDLARHSVVSVTTVRRAELMASNSPGPMIRRSAARLNRQGWNSSMLRAAGRACGCASRHAEVVLQSRTPPRIAKCALGSESIAVSAAAAGRSLECRG